MPVQCTCSTCGAVFFRKPRQAAAARFCSRACKHVRTTEPPILSDDGLTASLPLRARDGSLKGFAVIDVADLPIVGEYRWHMSEGYARRGEWIDGKHVGTLLHRQLLGLDRSGVPDVDHIDRDRLNNRRANLRTLTRAENGQNKSKRKGSPSPFKGVHFHPKTGKWQAAVRGQYLGLFSTQEEAGAAAREARLRLMPFAVD